MPEVVVNMAAESGKTTIKVEYEYDAGMTQTHTLRTSPDQTLAGLKDAVTSSLIERKSRVFTRSGVIQLSSSSSSSSGAGAGALATFELFLRSPDDGGLTFLNPRRKVSAYNLGFATVVFCESRVPLRVSVCADLGSAGLTKTLVVDSTWYLPQVLHAVGEVLSISPLVVEWFSLASGEDGTWLTPRLQLCQHPGGPPPAVQAKLKYLLPLPRDVLDGLSATVLLAIFTHILDSAKAGLWGVTPDAMYRIAGFAAAAVLGLHNPDRHGLGSDDLDPKAFLPRVLLKKDKKKAGKALVAAHAEASAALAASEEHQVEHNAMLAAIGAAQGLPFYGMRYFAVESASSVPVGKKVKKAAIVLGISNTTVLLGALATPVPWGESPSFYWGSTYSVLRQFPLGDLVSWSPDLASESLVIVFTDLQVRIRARDPYAICECLSTCRLLQQALSSTLGGPSGEDAGDGGDAPPPLPSRMSSYASGGRKSRGRRKRSGTISGSSEYQVLLTRSSDPSFLMQATYEAETVDELRMHVRSSLMASGTEAIDVWDPTTSEWIPLTSLSTLRASANMGKLRIFDNDGVEEALPEFDMTVVVMDEGEDEDEFESASNTSSLSSSFDEDFLLN